MARRLPQFHEVEAALSAGRLSWSQARLITTRAHPAEQQKWVTEALSLNVRQLAAALPPRAAPILAPSAPHQRVPPTRASAQPAPAVQPPAWQHLNLKMSPERFALASRLLERHQDAAGGSAAEIVLAALAGAGDAKAVPGPPHLLVILTCPSCAKATLPTSRGELPVDRALLRSANCDAIVEAADGSRRSVIPPRTRRIVMQRARFRCEAPGCRHAAFLEIHHRLPAAQGGGHGPENLIVLCSRCHRRLHEDEDAARGALNQSPI